MKQQPLQKTVFKNSLFGIKLFNHLNDNKIGFTILMEDDDYWRKTNVSGVDSFWIDDLIDVLKKTKKYLKNNATLNESKTYCGEIPK